MVIDSFSLILHLIIWLLHPLWHCWEQLQRCSLSRLEIQHFKLGKHSGETVDFRSLTPQQDLCHHIGPLWIILPALLYCWTQSQSLLTVFTNVSCHFSTCYHPLIYTVKWSVEVNSENILAPCVVWKHVDAKCTAGTTVIGPLASWGIKHMWQCRLDSCCLL